MNSYAPADVAGTRRTRRVLTMPSRQSVVSAGKTMTRRRVPAPHRVHDRAGYLRRRARVRQDQITDVFAFERQHVIRQGLCAARDGFERPPLRCGGIDGIDAGRVAFARERLAGCDARRDRPPRACAEGTQSDNNRPARGSVGGGPPLNSNVPAIRTPRRSAMARPGISLSPTLSGCDAKSARAALSSTGLRSTIDARTV